MLATKRDVRVGRYLVQCCGNERTGYRYQGTISVPCGYREWLDVEEWHEGVYPNRIRRHASIPAKCRCGAWLSNPVRLEVSEASENARPHTCENTCQWSESSKCRCACGGRKHGFMLREEWP